MTQAEVDNYIERARMFENQVFVQREYDKTSKVNIPVDYTFIGINGAKGIGEAGVMVFTIDGRLRSPSGQIITIPLERIVTYFEAL